MMLPPPPVWFSRSTAPKPRLPLVNGHVQDSTDSLVGSAFERKVNEQDSIRVKPDTTKRLQDMRRLMIKDNLDYYIVVSEDAHHSEWVAESDKRREFISGFTGTTGQAIVSMHSAFLLTDSRYWLQAQEEIDENWTLVKAGSPGEIQDWIGWILRHVGSSRIGIDARMISGEKATLLNSKLGSIESKLVFPPQNLVDLIWKEKPAKPDAAIYIQSIEFAGRMAGDKLRKLRKWIQQHPSSAPVSIKEKMMPNRYAAQVATLVTSLTCIAYILNLRGSDIPDNQLFHAYLFVDLESAVLFVEISKVQDDVASYLKKINVQLRSYTDIWPFIRRREWGDGKVLITPQTSYAILLMLTHFRYTLAPSYIEHMMSVENETKIDYPRSTIEEFKTADASNSTTSGNMFSTNNACFMGGSYYHVQGDAHFSPLSQVPFGFETLHRNISSSAFHDSRARFPPPRCHPSTRKDILAKIMDYIIAPPSSSKILHLFGSEGRGKSAIAQTIAEYCKTNGTLGACFFFSRVSSERNTDKNIIATLAYQLCVTVPELKLFIAKAVEDDLSTFQKDVDTQMERLIINPIIQATKEGKTLRYPILIVIDGLDECEGAKEQCAFLRAISGAIGRYSLPLYFFITSRQEGHIVNCLNEDRTLRSILDLDQNHVQTKKDIEAYICSEFERIRSVHHIPESSSWPSQANIQMVVSKTNMLFSRASEIMAFIDQKNAPSPETQLEFILRTSDAGVKSQRPAKVLSGLRAASSAASNLNHDKPKSKPNREENDGTVISDTSRVGVIAND